MHSQTIELKKNARKALHDDRLKAAINRTTVNAVNKRAAAVESFPEFQASRDFAAKVKDHVIDNWTYYLDEFEHNAVKSGARVHWAQTDQQACDIVIDICKKNGAKLITRAKSMLGEEIGLPHALEKAGLERIETDLAEHIVQLADQTPSHIIWPAMHITREQVADMFSSRHRKAPGSGDIESLVNSARKELREKFMSADVGITGANFLLADSGAVCTVTNEGNGELTTTPPKVHIVTAGIEKLVPSLAHCFPLLRLLVRSATGADITQYTTFYSGPKRQGDADGPEEMHIVLVDNGRSKMLSSGFREMLRCIRCGACMNHCAVYTRIGGHAYDAVYPGPMGTVITPVLEGLKPARELVHACTLNGKCAEVCPVKIPLPTLIRSWRTRSWESGYEPVTVRAALAFWGFLAQRPAVYKIYMSIVVRFLKLASKGGWIKTMPMAGAWTKYRDLPAPEGKTFMQQYSKAVSTDE